MNPTDLTVPLYRLAHGRTGDKGDRSNISVIAWHPALWDVLDGGVNDALNLDSHGKALSFLLLDLPVRMPAALVHHLAGAH